MNLSSSSFYLIFIILSSLIYSSHQKGIYLIEEKNGKTYTRPVPIESRKEISEQMKKLFDIDFYGRKNEINDELNEKAVSKYMENLYKEIAEFDNSDSLTDEDDNLWTNADKIVSTTAEVSSPMKNGTYRMKFNIEDIPNDQRIIKSQLRIHFNKIKFPTFINLVDTSILSNNYLITSEDPIIEYDITELVMKWINEPMFNAPSIDIHSSIKTELNIDAFIVIALKDANIKKTRRRFRRDVQSNPSVPIPKREPRRTQSAYFERPDSNAMCQKKGLYVDFDSLGWKKWLMAPDGFSAFYCTGECRAPFHQSLNATAHAIVQSLIHLARPNATTQSRCAPSKLSSIKILLKDKKNIQIKRYRDMVVEECGCH